MCTEKTTSELTEETNVIINEQFMDHINERKAEYANTMKQTVLCCRSNRAQAIRHAIIATQREIYKEMVDALNATICMPSSTAVLIQAGFQFTIFNNMLYYALPLITDATEDGDVVCLLFYTDMDKVDSRTTNSYTACIDPEKLYPLTTKISCTWNIEPVTI